MTPTLPAQGKEFFYDTIADRFDVVMNRYDLGRRVEIIFDDLLSESVTGRTLLDVGCGTGWFSQRAVARGAHVVALDIGLRLLEKTREKCNVTLIGGDACRLPFVDASVDVVLSSECVEHTRDPLAAVDEMCRVLKPGGILVLTVPNRLWRLSATVAATFKLRPYEGLENWLWWGQLRRALEGQGLQIATMTGFHLFPPVCTRVLARSAVCGPLRPRDRALHAEPGREGGEMSSVVTDSPAGVD